MTEEQKLAEAREICARDEDRHGFPLVAARYRNAELDWIAAMRIALAALNRGIEIGKGEA